MELIGKLPAHAFAAPPSNALPLVQMAAVAQGGIVAIDKDPAVKRVAKQYVDELKAARLEAIKGIGEKEAPCNAFIEQFGNRESVLCREVMPSASPGYFRPGREEQAGAGLGTTRCEAHRAADGCRARAAACARRAGAANRAAEGGQAGAGSS